LKSSTSNSTTDNGCSLRVAKLIASTAMASKACRLYAPVT